MNNPIVQEVDNEFILIVAISVFFLLLITVAMIYFVIRYRKSRNPVASNITGNTTLEVLWTVIPLALVMLIFYYGWAGFKTMRDTPEDAMTVKVTARMWRWSFEYSNGNQATTGFISHCLSAKGIPRNIFFQMDFSYGIPSTMV